MARRACATVLLCGYRIETHNFDYVIYFNAKGGEPPDGSAAWPLQQSIEAAVRAHCSEFPVRTTARGGERSFGFLWVSSLAAQSGHSAEGMDLRSNLLLWMPLGLQGISDLLDL